MERQLKIHPVKLNINASKQPVLTGHVLVQGDDAHGFGVTLVSKSNLDLSNVTFTMTFVKPDGTRLLIDSESVDVSQKYIVFVVPNSVVSESGKYTSSVEVYNTDGSVFTTSHFVFDTIARLNDGSGTEALVEFDTTSKIIASEKSRKDNEVIRVANEQIRITNEDLRVAYHEGVKVFEEYNNSKTYYPNNKVLYGQNTYMNILQCTGVSPLNYNNWLLIVKKGEDGMGAIIEGISVVNQNNSTNIPFSINYNPQKDKLLVYDENRILLDEGINYNINANNSSIDLIGWSADVGHTFRFQVVINSNPSVIVDKISEIDGIITLKSDEFDTVISDSENKLAEISGVLNNISGEVSSVVQLNQSISEAEQIRVSNENTRLTNYNTLIQRGLIIPKMPVASVSALTTTYPSPQNGWTVRITAGADINKVYRYSGESNQWEYIDYITSSSYDALVSQYLNILYSDWIEATSSIISMPADCVEGQLSDVRLMGNTYTNAINNGNFANGTTGWGSAGTTNTITISNNRVTFNGTAMVSGGRFQDIKANTGDILYLMFSFSKVSDVTPNMGFSDFGSFTNLTYSVPNNGRNSILLTAKQGGLRLYLQQLAGSTYNNAYLTDILVINLTQHGLDSLTADQMNARIPNWFDGTKQADSHRLRSVGKNLLPTNLEEWEQGSLNSNGTLLSATTRLRTKRFLPIQPNINIIRSVATGYVITGIYFYDENYNFISTTPSASAVVPSNARYYKTLFAKSDGISAITITDVELAKPQLERGTTATPYEPHESNSITTPPIGRSLPNGVKDEFNVITGVKRQNVSGAWILKDSDITSYNTSFSTVDRIFISLSIFQQMHNVGVVDQLGTKVRTNMTSPALGTQNHWTHAFSDLVFIIYVPKGQYADINAVRNALSGNLSLNYQLAVPVETKPMSGQELKVYKNGTIFVEPIGNPTESTLPTLRYKYPKNLGAQVKGNSDSIMRIYKKLLDYEVRLQQLESIN